MTDVQLLNLHRSGDESAFPDLVRRHLPWVFGVARRRLRDSHMAEDVAQAVFILLHRKAPAFDADGAMINWLHKAAWYASENVIRQERRRKCRETEAAMLHTNQIPSDEWSELAPILDDLIEKLSHTDREAILLRYYRDLTFAEVGEQIGSSEEAARKRVERAVEKLKRFVEQRGLTVASGALALTLSDQIRIQPPAGLISTSTTIASANSAISTSSQLIAKGASTLMFTATSKLIATAAAVILVLGAGALGLTKSHNARVQLAKSGGQGFAMLAPFTDTRWRPEVQVNGKWYALVAINDIPAEDIVKFAQDTFGPDLWQKRFDEDLVEVMTDMNHAPGPTVKLTLRTLDTNEQVIIEKAPMTHENRQKIWSNRNEKRLAQRT